MIKLRWEAGQCLKEINGRKKTGEKNTFNFVHCIIIQRWIW